MKSGIDSMIFVMVELLFSIFLKNLLLIFWEKIIFGEKILTYREKIFANKKKYYLVSNKLF